MDAVSSFIEWRKNNSADQSWGLAWFLANEMCKRFYASHGILPWVIGHQGLGYYGIALNQLKCKVHNSRAEPLGRFTMGGDVENCATGSGGDHRLDTIKLCDDGASIDTLITEAINHFRFPPFPEQSHLHCRHKSQRWESG